MILSPQTTLAKESQRAKKTLKNRGQAFLPACPRATLRQAQGPAPFILRASCFVFFLLLLIALPGTVHAEYEPLSPAVARVIERAEAARQEAIGDGLFDMFFDYEDEWAEEALMLVYEAYTQKAVITHTKTHLHDTACFAYDKQHVMQRKIHEVQLDIEAAEETGNIYRIFSLKNVEEWLTTQLAALEEGGLNPTLSNGSWFDIMFSESEEDVFFDEEFCFYDSDYTDPSIDESAVSKTDDDSETIDGYGCDAQMLQQIENQLPDGNEFKNTVVVEREAREIEERAVESQAITQQTFGFLLTNLETVAQGEETQGESPRQRREHKTETGCREQRASGVIPMTLRTMFGIAPKDMEHVFEYQEDRAEQNEERQIQDDFKFPEPQGNDGFSVLDLLHWNEQSAIKTFTREQSLESAKTAALDTSTSLQTAFGELRSSIRELVTLGNALSTPENPTKGLRDFVRDFVGFLLRSCTGRPCKERLERVGRLVFNNACFAYGNGEYLNATPENPQWRQCLCEAAPEDPACNL